ncbi:MAG: tetratricopeptide repeat protein [Pseudomonadota bacterium]
MKLRFILAVLAVLASTHARADDANDCVKASGDTAIAACTRAIESGRWQGANLAWAYVNRGDGKQGKGDLDGAIADYTRALEIDPRHVGAYINRGIAKRAKGDLDGAMADYNRALEIDPRHVGAYINRGFAKMHKGDLDGAIADYNHALKLDPRHVKAYYNRGNAKQVKGDLDGAIADYNRALELDPRRVRAYNNRGVAKRHKGDLDGAIADYNRALELDPRRVNAYHNRGNAKKDKGDLDGAIADYNRTLDLDPRKAITYEARGRTHYYKGEFALATADFNRAQELKPDTYTALRLFLARTRSGTDGRNELTANTVKLDTTKWPAPVVALYLGKSSPVAVLKSAEHADPKTHKEQLCEANFYIGQWQLTKGDRASATASLRTARDHCPKTFVEYTGAVHELKRLGVK